MELRYAKNVIKKEEWGNSVEGWVAIYRKLACSSLWLKQKFTKGQAWIDLIILANHKDGVIEKRGNQIIVIRGQVGWLELALSTRWKWSKNKTTEFLKWLKNEEQNDTTENENDNHHYHSKL